MSDARPDAETPGTTPADGHAAGGVRRLTGADARGRRGRLARRADDEAGLPESRPGAQNLAIVVGAMGGGPRIAELAGAANLGTALSFGQIAFAIALVYVLVKR
jgi:hypothetical protein